MKTILFILGACLAACKPESDAGRLHAPIFQLVGDTGSMEPAIHGGDPIMILPAAFDENLVGQVVVFWWPAKKANMLHRCIDVRTEDGVVVAIVTKGDNQPERDFRYVTQDEFIGIAVPYIK